MAWQALGAASLALLVAGAGGCKSGPELAPSGSTIGTGVGIARLQRESFAVRPLAKTRWSSLLLDAGALLPPIPPPPQPLPRRTTAATRVVTTTIGPSTAT